MSALLYYKGDVLHAKLTQYIERIGWASLGLIFLIIVLIKYVL